MKNITISVDDETYRKARILAAEEDTTVTAMLRAHLEEKTRRREEFERLVRLQEELFATEKGLDPDQILTRDELYSEKGDARFR